MDNEMRGISFIVKDEELRMYWQKNFLNQWLTKEEGLEGKIRHTRS